MCEKCAICLESTDNNSYKALCCNNRFHFECLDTWFKIKNTCPLCRREYAYMNKYKNELEEYFDKIKNIDFKEVLTNLTDNIAVYKYQFEELDYSGLSKFLGKTENFLNVLKDYYNQ